MQEAAFVGFDGKGYSANAPHEGKFDIHHDGRFWHITFPSEDEPGGSQVYRGRNLPQAADHDRWVRYKPYPVGMKNRTAK